MYPSAPDAHYVAGRREAAPVGIFCGALVDGARDARGSDGGCVWALT
jgi:hypothetical protein